MPAYEATSVHHAVTKLFLSRFTIAGKNLYNNEHVAIKLVSPLCLYVRTYVHAYHERTQC